MTIIITGANGFIGRHLLSALDVEKTATIVLDQNICESLDDIEKADVVVHLAAKSQSASSNTNEKTLYETNIQGTLNILEYCRKQTAKMVFISTSGVYKSESTESIKETDSIYPQSPYSRSKLMGEKLCRAYAEIFNVNSVILRLFNVYGPNQNVDYLIPYIISNLLAGTPLTLKNPQSIRDFIYISDVAAAIIAATNHNQSGCHIYNIGSGQMCTVGDVTTVIEEICGKKRVNCNKKKQKSDRNPYSVANIDKAKTELHWQPKTDLRQGLEKIISRDIR